MSYIGKQPRKAALTSSDIEDGIITAAKIEDGAVVAAEIASNAVTTAKINADAVTGAKIADDAINSEHYTDGSIDTAHIAADQITNAKIADDQIDSEHYVDGSIDLAHLAADSVNATKIADNAISEEHLDVTAITGHTAETSVADGDLVVVHDASASALRKMTVANLVANAGGGKILQVQHTVVNGAVTINSGTSATTGITKAITPTANDSKILVLITGRVSVNLQRATCFVGLGLKRTIAGGSKVNLQGGGNNDSIAFNNFNVGTLEFQDTFAFSHVDVPETTSACTYVLEAKRETSGEAMAFNGGSGSQITLFELGA